MTKLHISDLSISKELDGKAMTAVRGGTDDQAVGTSQSNVQGMVAVANIGNQTPRLLTKRLGRLCGDRAIPERLRVLDVRRVVHLIPAPVWANQRNGHYFFTFRSTSPTVEFGVRPRTDRASRSRSAIPFR